MKFKWQQAPVKTQWGDEMVVASVAIDNDHTVCLYCEHDQTAKVEAMFTQRTWVGLSHEEVMVAAYQAGFDIHEDYDNEDDPDEMHWWTPDGESCDDSLLKLRDLIEAKLKEKNI